MAEVEKATSLGFERVAFTDDNLAADRDRFLSLCDALRTSRVHWDFNGRSEQIDREMLATAAGAGCTGKGRGFAPARAHTLPLWGDG